MREKTVEAYLRREVKKAGGLCEKHVSPGQKGVPDRLVTWPSDTGGPGRMHLIETKAPDGALSGPQKRDHRRRLSYGVMVKVIWTKEQVNLYVLMHGIR